MIPAIERLRQQLESDVKQQKARLIYQLFGLVLSVIGGVMIWREFGWGALIALFLLFWGNNISMRKH